MSAAIDRVPITDRASWLEMRRKDVTASAVGALLGVHEYVTPYALWAEKAGHLAADEGESEAMRRGRHVERLAVELIREERPTWSVEPGAHYFRAAADRLGATPDILAHDPERGPGIVQIKSVEPGVFRRKWHDEAGEIDVPLWIAVQSITEAHLTGATWAAVAPIVIGFGIELPIIDVPVHAGVVARIREAVAEFWALVERGDTPAPDFGRDAALIERLFRGGEDEADPVDLSGDNMLPALLDERAALSAQKSEADKRLREIKAELLFKLGEASSGRAADGRLITARTVNRKAYSVNASSYRDVRIKGEAA